MKIGLLLVGLLGLVGALIFGWLGVVGSGDRSVSKRYFTRALIFLVVGVLALSATLVVLLS